MFSSGIILSFGMGVLNRIVKESLPANETDEVVNKKTFLVLIVLGVFEFLGGIIITPLADKFSKKKVAIFTNLLYLCAIVSSIITHY